MWPIAIAVLAASVVVPVGQASAEVVKTRISLREFKRTYDIARVARQLIDPLADGVTFKLVRRGKNGNLIDFSNPNHTWTSARRKLHCVPRQSVAAAARVRIPHAGQRAIPAPERRA